MSEARRAAHAAELLSRMRCGDRIPFAAIGDEFRVGDIPERLDADTVVGTMWMMREGRVELLVSGPERGLLFTLATWLTIWLPVYPALAPLQYAEAIDRAA
jgi:hypothetical protein